MAKTECQRRRTHHIPSHTHLLLLSSLFHPSLSLQLSPYYILATHQLFSLPNTKKTWEIPGSSFWVVHPLSSINNVGYHHSSQESMTVTLNTSISTPVQHKQRRKHCTFLSSIQCTLLNIEKIRLYPWMWLSLAKHMEQSLITVGGVTFLVYSSTPPTYTHRLHQSNLLVDGIPVSIALLLCDLHVVFTRTLSLCSFPYTSAHSYCSSNHPHSAYILHVPSFHDKLSLSRPLPHAEGMQVLRGCGGSPTKGVWGADAPRINPRLQKLYENTNEEESWEQ